MTGGVAACTPRRLRDTRVLAAGLQRRRRRLAAAGTRLSAARASVSLVTRAVDVVLVMTTLLLVLR